MDSQKAIDFLTLCTRQRASLMGLFASLLMKKDDTPLEQVKLEFIEAFCKMEDSGKLVKDSIDHTVAELARAYCVERTIGAESLEVINNIIKSKQDGIQL